MPGRSEKQQGDWSRVKQIRWRELKVIRSRRSQQQVVLDLVDHGGDFGVYPVRGGSHRRVLSRGSMGLPYALTEPLWLLCEEKLKRVLLPCAHHVLSVLQQSIALPRPL